MNISNEFHLLRKIELLSGLDQLINEVYNYKEIPCEFVISNYELIHNIKKSKLFTSPNALYGHRYNKNITSSWKLRDGPADVFTTDNRGILKNDLNFKNTDKRIIEAKNKGNSIIYFFGGSTMMSMGSVTPNFSIPALVERILKIKFGVDTVCINFALGGTCSRESLYLYLNEGLGLDDAANSVFYDGWNDASYLIKKNILEFNFEKQNLNFAYKGESLRNIENNFTLSNKFNIYWHLKYSKNLFIGNLFNFFLKILPAKYFERIFSSIQSRLFPLLIDQIELQNFYKNETNLEVAIQMAVDEYIEIHKIIEKISLSNNSGFLWLLQPLVFWGEKPLSVNEEQWKQNGYSSGNPDHFIKFKNYFDKIAKKKQLFENYFYDLTDIFNDITQETYIDSGHLNRLGNLIISSKIASLIYDNKNSYNL